MTRALHRAQHHGMYMNEFSIICRLLGSLYYRHPSDAVMAPIFALISEGKLARNWPLEQDELLARLQKSVDLPGLTADYEALFMGEACRVPPYRSHWQEEGSEADVRAFLQARGMKIMRQKMRAKRLKPCSPSICCPGARHSSVKQKPMPPRRSGGPWLRSRVKRSWLCGMSSRKKTNKSDINHICNVTRISYL